VYDKLKRKSKVVREPEGEVANKRRQVESEECLATPEEVYATRKRKGREEEVQGGLSTHSKLSVKVREVEYAKYGVVEGVMAARQVECVRCSIVSGGWPSWAFGAEGTGFKVVDLLLFNDEWEDTLSRLLPGVHLCNLVKGSDVKTTRKVELEKVDVVFTDIDPPSRAHVWDLARCIVISSRRVRRTPPNWREEVLAVKHSSCGGVTDTNVYIHI